MNLKTGTMDGKLRLKLLVLTLLTVACSNGHGAQSNAGIVIHELKNKHIIARFVVDDDHLQVAFVLNRATGEKLLPKEIFSLKFSNRRIVNGSQMKIVDRPREESIAPSATASRLANRLQGKRICANLRDDASGLRAYWCAIVRDGTNYVRQEVTLEAGVRPAEITEVRMFDFAAPGGQVVGNVKGSPLVAGSFFFGFEFPLEQSSVENGRAIAILNRVLPLKPGAEITYSSVIGVAAPGQMRREFLSYLENERAHPYRTFLHYNTWYDLGYSGRYKEADVLNRINAFGEELVVKRGVTMDSTLFDDGWDDPRTVWQFNPNFPTGFARVRDAAKKYGFGIGVWMSPWGGYSTPKKQRVQAGEKAGYETVKGGFALSAPKYYQLFESTCLRMIANYGVNQFKFDGTGNADQTFPGSLFDSDFSAAIHLIERLREQEPDVFINLTTGTWPSPFWLRYSDSIWRNGEDHSFDGVGSWREKWITYRDEQTYRNVVLAGPLYPLNSLMLHGMIFAQSAKNLSTDPGNDFPNEVHSYFGTGTQLQEMYITPGLLTAQDWDTLAEAAKWSRQNAAVLKDVHWIGGDPAKLETYGWASWTRAKGIIVLRNPSDKAQAFTLDVGKAFELPKDAARRYKTRSPWAEDRDRPEMMLNAGEITTVNLAPFEVRTFEATPILPKK